MRRPYVKEDLISKNKAQLLDFVQAELDKWPYKQSDGLTARLNKSRVKIDVLREALLDTKNGFTTDAPHSIPQAPSPQPAVQQEAPLVNAIPSTNRRIICVYVNDRRLNTIAKHARSIEVDVADFAGCNVGEWRARTTEVIERLQLTPAVITGTGFIRLGVPDIVDPEFTHWFLEGDLPHIRLVTPDMEYLKVSTKSSLTLNLSTAIPTQPFGKRYRSYFPDADPDRYEDTNDEELAKRRKYTDLSVPPVKPLEVARKRHLEMHVEWLSAMARQRPGFEQFSKTRHRCCPVPEVISAWAFISQFYTAYYHKVTESNNSCKGCVITKVMICRALDMQDSTFSIAHLGHRLVMTYGRDGTHPAQEVMDTLEATDQPLAGSGQLIKFLRQWEADHPIATN